MTGKFRWWQGSDWNRNFVQESNNCNGKTLVSFVRSVYRDKYIFIMANIVMVHILNSLLHVHYILHPPGPLTEFKSNQEEWPISQFNSIFSIRVYFYFSVLDSFNR